MSVEPGWYPDGVTPGAVRWYDGRAWTEHTAAAPPAQVAPAQAPAAVVAPGGPGQAPWLPHVEPAATAGAPLAYPSGGWRPSAPADQGLVASSPYAWTDEDAPAVGSATPSGHAAAATGYGATYAPTGPVTPPVRPDAHRTTAGGSPYGSWREAARAQRRWDADDDRGTAVGLGAVGLGLLVVWAMLLNLPFQDGRPLWTGGFLAGLYFVVRAVIAYVRARRRGASALGVVTWAVGGVVLLVAMVLGYTALRPTVVQHAGVDAGIGSCFADAGAGVQVVSCAGDYDYRAVDRVDSLGDCPSGTGRTVRSGRDLLCLVDDAGG